MALLRTATAGLTAVCAILAFATLGTPAQAHKKTVAIDGLAGMHDIRSERGKLCMTDHEHFGTSEGHPTKRIAMREAVRSWQDFTDLEYGYKWSNYRLAAGKNMDCSKSGSWACEVAARPCKKPR